MKKFKAYLYKNCENAKEKINTIKDQEIVTIECEWGDKELKGHLSLSHHGTRQNNLAPSVFFKSGNYKQVNNPAFILSHIDADSVFGAMWVLGILDKNNPLHIQISEMVAQADVYGPHTVKEDLSNDVFRKWITIGWIVNRNNTFECGDITEKFKEILFMIGDVLESDIKKHPFYIEAYEWFTKIRKNAAQYIDYKTKYLTGFISPKFMLSNYNLTGIVKPFLIQFHTQTKRITVSAINEKVAKHVFGEGGLVTFMQEIFGEDAGGKVSIAGSPKDRKLTIKDYNRVKKIFRDKINEKLNEGVYNELISM